MPRQSFFDISSREAAEIVGLNPSQFPEVRSPIREEPQQQLPVTETEAAVEQSNPRNFDVATAWFSPGPINKQANDYYAQTGVLGNMDRDFATQFQGQNFENLEDYTQFGEQFIQQYPDLAPQVKQMMRESMPPAVKADYEDRMMQQKMFREADRQIELQKYQKENDPEYKLKVETAQQKAQSQNAKDAAILLDKATLIASTLDKETQSPQDYQRDLQRIQFLKQMADEALGVEFMESEATPQEPGIDVQAIRERAATFTPETWETVATSVGADQVANLAAASGATQIDVQNILSMYEALPIESRRVIVDRIRQNISK